MRPDLPIVASKPALDGRGFEGEIRSLASEVDPVTRSIVARAIVPNPDGALKPGLLMTVDLLKNPRQAIVIPEAALVPAGRQTFVLWVDESAGNKVVKREIRTGARRPGEVEVLAGLEPGDRVITRGTLQVRPGQAVEIMPVEQPGQALDDVLRKTPGS